MPFLNLAEMAKASGPAADSDKSEFRMDALQRLLEEMKKKQGEELRPQTVNIEILKKPE